VVVYLNLLSSRGLLPDLTYILDVSPKVGIGRAGKKGKDRFELEDLRFHDKVRKAYLDVAKKFPNRVRVVDSEKPLILVSSEIIKIADKFIKRGQL
jgi:dTMP kinase